MAKGLTPLKTKQTVVVKASLLNPKNLFVLATGLVTGGLFSPILIPLGVLAYGVMCYLDLSSEEFVNKILRTQASPADAARGAGHALSDPHPGLALTTKELQDLRAKIFTTRGKIQRLYEHTDDFTRQMLGELSQTEELVERSDTFLAKAQHIRDYLASENVGQIRRDIAFLQDKISTVEDDFSRRQYQQALETRYRHLDTLRDIQQVYERLVSQLTNIGISLESIYSSMMKLKTSEYSLASAESDQVSAQLTHLLREAETLDSALDEQLTLPD
ncbi:hypothetical protein GF339_18865 [candidate division KSB3 bacterium]|uniref:Uncharacterized protein n=1 Tax=candidate division KSB3 bacterium TaxID=2044937 RepID=A0A9D5Q7P1_9BACT|nr:hypothetical protein [candidate division KSB3 bacterium]MBD3326653.1 hypothetical protein [candidate division KSB3 bacterium]